MTLACALIAVALLVALAAFQIALAAGAPLGRFAWGGAHRVLPARLRIGSALSVVLYAAFAVLLLNRAGLLSWLPDLASQIGTWVLFGYLVLGVVLNAISRSRAERYTMTPVVILLAILTLVVALA